MTNAEVHDIPFTTLQMHITPNDSKRVELGSSVGRKPILDGQREAIIFDVLIRKDRANEGASVGEAVDILEHQLYINNDELQDPRARAQGGSDSAIKHSHFAHSPL